MTVVEEEDDALVPPRAEGEEVEAAAEVEVQEEEDADRAARLLVGEVVEIRADGFKMGEVKVESLITSDKICGLLDEHHALCTGLNTRNQTRNNLDWNIAEGANVMVSLDLLPSTRPFVRLKIITTGLAPFVLIHRSSRKKTGTNKTSIAYCYFHSASHSLLLGRWVWFDSNYGFPLLVFETPNHGFVVVP